jgi:hypothetical protein
VTRSKPERRLMPASEQAAASDGGRIAQAATAGRVVELTLDRFAGSYSSARTIRR